VLLTWGGSNQIGDRTVKKSTLAVFLAVVVAPVVLGCSAIDSLWDHTKWHLHGAYQDLVNIEKTIDYHIFNLDEANPDRY
jgi:hypothetical protein